tara:strand:- start:5168 stop:5818 length:651 start_codon:yes stop_codon:yes gene_type:complete
LYLCRNNKTLILTSINISVAIALPIIGGSIGWFTNFLAVKMLFYPRDPIAILGMEFQGVFPKRQATVATKIGQLVASELLASEEIFKHIGSEQNLNKIKLNIGKILANYFDLSFVQKYPLAAKLLPNKIKLRIQEEILNEVDQVIPSIMQAQVSQLEKSLDIERIVADKVKQLSSKRLEKIIWSILADEFIFIEWVGAFLGFTIGLVQVLVGFVLF